MGPEDFAALERFKKEVGALDGDALLDRWIAQEYQPKLTELDVQQELYLEIALGAKFGLSKWRNAVKERKQANRRD